MSWLPKLAIIFFINSIMKAIEFLPERKKPSEHRCKSGKKMGNSDRASCVSQGFIAHDSDHTDGKGNYLRGKKVKGGKYGGPLE